jgi:hypothetical protein
MFFDQCSIPIAVAFLRIIKRNIKILFCLLEK